MDLPSLAVLDGVAGPRIWLPAEANNMRCAFDWLAERVQTVIGESPLRGYYFVFRSRCNTRLKVLVADAYSGVVTNNQITRAECWADLRRKFVDAGKSRPGDGPRSGCSCARLYVTERQAQALTVGQRKQLRQEKAAPLLDELHQRLLLWKEQLLPRHPLGEAIAWALG